MKKFKLLFVINSYLLMKGRAFNIERRKAMKNFKEDMKGIAGAFVITFGCVIGPGSTINGIIGGICMYFGLKLCGIDLLDVFRM